jgi:undecaprenyl-diphosphatase
MTWFEVFYLSLVEGLTEFIPVSSTGHLILTSFFLSENATEFSKAFHIVIQFGAILAVVYCYPERFKWNLPFFSKLAVGFLPAAVIGLLFKKRIEFLLESVQVIAWALILGGVVFLFIDKRLKNFVRKDLTIETLSYKQCLLIGLAQCCAFIPGMSRSASTIIGGVFVGLDRTSATLFSFFLAVPTLTGAAGIKLFDALQFADQKSLMQLGAGVVLSFVFSVVALRLLIHLVGRFGFAPFGWYRIAIGLLVLWMVHF